MDAPARGAGRLEVEEAALDSTGAARVLDSRLEVRTTPAELADELRRLSARPVLPPGADCTRCYGASTSPPDDTGSRS